MMVSRDRNSALSPQGARRSATGPCRAPSQRSGEIECRAVFSGVGRLERQHQVVVRRTTALRPACRRRRRGGRKTRVKRWCTRSGRLMCTPTVRRVAFSPVDAAKTP